MEKQMQTQTPKAARKKKEWPQLAWGLDVGGSNVDIDADVDGSGAGIRRLEAGVDEAGRGSLAGPVFAAAVVWPSSAEDEALLRADPRMELVRDSKTLSAAQRAKARAFIEAEALAWGVGTADAAEIDRDNILRATMRAMRRALDDMHVRLREKAEAAEASEAAEAASEGGQATTSAPERQRHPRAVDAVLIDGERFEGYLSPEPPHEFLPYACVIDGDARFLSVAAASVLAKTHHDEHVVRDMHPRFPAYGWDRNKCYGSADHIATLRRIGACEEHRTKFVSKFV